MTQAQHIEHKLAQQNSALELVQLTDMHLFVDTQGTLLGVETEREFTQCLTKAQQHYPNADAFLITGDIAQECNLKVYERFRRHMQHTQKPYFCLSGNHDDDKLVANSPIDFTNNQLIDTPHWRILMLNSSVAKTPSGLLSTDDLAWLEITLAKHADKHVLICLHHHPVALGSQWLDTHILKNADALWQTLADKPYVKAVVCGHVHQALDTMVDGIRVLATPSTSIQFKPKCHDFTIDCIPAGFRWLQLFQTGELATKVIRLDNVPPSLDREALGY